VSLGGRSQDLPNCTCIQNKKLVTNKFKSGGLHEKHVVATWNVENRLSAFAYRHRGTEKILSRGGNGFCEISQMT
jgi:hypothetical protein